MFCTTLHLRSCATALAAAGFLLLSAVSAAAQAARVGGTQLPIQGFVRFPSVSYDATNDAYLVAHGHGSVTVRFISAAGVPLGTPLTLNTGASGAARVACGPAPSE